MSSSRRDFLRGAAAASGGLALAFHFGLRGRLAEAAAPERPLPPANAFVRIGTDDVVTVVLAHSEMGQGIWTGLAMLIAEELDCDWSKVRCEHAPTAPVYGHPFMGIQMTGGSSTTNGEMDRYRQVGAAAKDMLLRAAAARWKTSPAKLRAERGVIQFGKQQLTYGAVAQAAMALAPPKQVRLKDPNDWKIIGTHVRRLDTPEKITGAAQFGLDVQFPGLRVAMVARPPAFGATLGTFDPAPAMAVAGVEKVVSGPNWVAVVAKHTWAAKLGRDALKLEWKAPAQPVSTAGYEAQLRALAQKPGAIAEREGDVERKLAAVERKLVAEYEVPYLAHASMEPLNCTVRLEGDKCEIWTGTQFQTVDRAVAAKIAGVPEANVTLHTPFLGGGFGRRANPVSDFVAEAVAVAKAAAVPVKVVWTREDDTRGGYYRPAYAHRVSVGLDGAGRPVAWDHVIAGQSILGGTPFAAFAIKDGIDESSIEGVKHSPYLHGVADRRVSLHTTTNDVPVLWWRSVGNTHTAFVMESMIDEAAHAAGQDALAYRVELLGASSRHAAALRLAAEKAGWGKPLAAGRALGLAVHESFGSIVAQVAEVSVDHGRIRVHHVHCAVDCGVPVNPLGIEAQVQGSVGFALTAALYGKLNVVDGKVVESNFHDYRLLRIHEMPKVSVHLIRSGARMGGIGEPAVPPVAPAVANAVFALTGQRLRALPLQLAKAQGQ